MERQSCIHQMEKSDNGRSSEPHSGRKPQLVGAFRFVRLEARDRRGDMIALTNPIWLRSR
jgi:hypothetical protein